MLREIGSVDRKTIDAIAVTLQHPDGNVRMAAAEALESFGFEARSAIPALNIAYAHEGEYPRRAILKALKTLHAAR